MAEIDEKLITELTNAIKGLEAVNREQRESVGDVIRKMNDPTYKGGAFGGYGGASLTADLVSRMFDKLSKSMESLGGRTQAGAAGGSKLSSSASTADNNPAANAAKQARDNANASARGGAMAPAGQTSAHASTPNFNPAARTADFFSRISQQAPSAMNVAARYASDFNRSIIQPARSFGAMQTNLNYMGELQGLSGAGGDITIPGTNIGFRTPFNAAFGRGLEMKFEALKASMGAGITMAQQENIQNTLVGA